MVGKKLSARTTRELRARLAALEVEHATLERTIAALKAVLDEDAPTTTPGGRPTTRADGRPESGLPRPMPGSLIG